MILLSRKFGSLASVARKDESRPFLAGVHVTAEEGRATAEATDGTVLVRVTQNEGAVNPQDYPIVTGLPQTNGDWSVIIPAKAWDGAFKKAPKAEHMPILNNVAIAHTEDRKQIVLASTDLDTANVSPTLPIEGQYPRTDAVWPKDKPKFEVSFNAKALEHLLKVLGGCAEDSHASVKFAFRGSSSPAQLTVNHPVEGYSVEALIMPVRER